MSADEVPRLEAGHGGRVEGGAAQRAGVVLLRRVRTCVGAAALDDPPRSHDDRILRISRTTPRLCEMKT